LPPFRSTLSRELIQSHIKDAQDEIFVIQSIGISSDKESDRFQLTKTLKLKKCGNKRTMTPQSLLNFHLK